MASSSAVVRAALYSYAADARYNEQLLRGTGALYIGQLSRKGLLCARW